MTIQRNLSRALGAALLASSLGACDFVNISGQNPNAVPTATVDQLFTGIQANTYFFSEAQIARDVSMWMQQMAGTDRQYQTRDTYIFGEDEGDAEFSTLYTGAGLVDLRRAQTLADQANRKVYAGILRIHEAYLIGMAASVWGDIPYSEAADPAISTPKLDPQAQVYAAVQALLDRAIADLQSGQGAGPGAADFNFGGNAASWVRVANTLKARFYMHWVKPQLQGRADANTACGGNCLQKALAAAQNGINSSAGNWRARHGKGQPENNLWHQFLRDRSGYISGGAFLINLLNNGTPANMADDDPRLPIYFTRGSGSFSSQFIGSPPGTPPGDPNQNASQLNLYGEPDFNQPLVTCSENQFIIAEASYYQNNLLAARNALQAGMACEQARLGVQLRSPSPLLTGTALLREIMLQKYIAMFLNMEVWNDWKRTGIPTLTPASGRQIPRRMLYGQSERQANPNVPAPDKQPARNPNDPAGSTSGL